MDAWRSLVESFYPKLLQRTYCVPPVIFNRVSYARDTVGGQPVLVLQNPMNKPPTSDTRSKPPHDNSSVTPSGLPPSPSRNSRQGLGSDDTPGLPWRSLDDGGRFVGDSSACSYNATDAFREFPQFPDTPRPVSHTSNTWNALQPGGCTQRQDFVTQASFAFEGVLAQAMDTTFSGQYVSPPCSQTLVPCASSSSFQAGLCRQPRFDKGCFKLAPPHGVSSLPDSLTHVQRSPCCPDSHSAQRCFSYTSTQPVPLQVNQPDSRPNHDGPSVPFHPSSHCRNGFYGYPSHDQQKPFITQEQWMEFYQSFALFNIQAQIPGQVHSQTVSPRRFEPSWERSSSWNTDKSLPSFSSRMCPGPLASYSKQDQRQVGQQCSFINQPPPFFTLRHPSDSERCPITCQKAPSAVRTYQNLSLKCQAVSQTRQTTPEKRQSTHEKRQSRQKCQPTPQKRHSTPQKRQSALQKRQSVPQHCQPVIPNLQSTTQQSAYAGQALSYRRQTHGPKYHSTPQKRQLALQKRQSVPQHCQPVIPNLQSTTQQSASAGQALSYRRQTHGPKYQRTSYSMWTKDPDPQYTPAHVYEHETRDDFVQQHVLHCLQELGHHQKEVMFVLSQVNFAHYLNKPSYAAACARFPKVFDLPGQDRRGDFDILLIHRHYGVLVGEIKAVGLSTAQVKSQFEADADVAKRVWRAVRQLDKSERVLRHLLSDVVPSLAVRKTVILPYVSRARLQRVLCNDPELEQTLQKTLGARKATGVLDLCLCEDQLSPRDTPWHVQPVLRELSAWWRRRMVCSSPQDMSDDVYINIVSRFVGPATTVSVHCVVPPRVEVRTEGEAVSEVGERMARVVLTPRQVGLVSRPQRMVCLTGPPGTGKTLLLVLKGLCWLRQGHDVHVVSLDPFSSATSRLIVHQLRMTLRSDPVTDTPMPRGKVLFRQFDFYKKEADVEADIKKLCAASQGGRMFVLVDEADFGHSQVGPGHTSFVTVLSERVPNLSLWAASIKHDAIPNCLQVEPMTVPLRSAPVVIREVLQGIRSKQFGKSVLEYTESGLPSPCDGPKVIRLRHEGAGHVGDWPVACFKCGEQVAEVLRQLHVGGTGQGPSSRDKTAKPPPLRYRDVFVLTRSELSDVITDDSGQVTSRPCDFVAGLRASGVPVRVVWWRDDLNRYVGGLEDLWACKVNQVTVTDWDGVTGLERKVVVYLPGRYPGVDDWRGDSDVHDSGKVYAVSRCTSQLVLVDLPHIATRNDETEVETEKNKTL